MFACATSPVIRSELWVWRRVEGGIAASVRSTLIYRLKYRLVPAILSAR